MAKKGIGGLIKDLDYIEKNFKTLFNKDIDNIIATLILKVGKSTAYDTCLVRDLLSNILMDLGRIDLVPELEAEVYEFWKTRQEREQEGSDYTYDKIITPNGIKYNISINDEGFYNQNQGKVSSVHPRNDANVIPYNVSYYQDKLETYSDIDMNKACEALKLSIIKAIERGVKHG